MDDQKFKGKEAEVKVLEKEGVDQVAGGKGELKVICLHCGLTEDEWIK